MATTFTPSAGNIIRPYGRSKVKHFPEAASQTFKRGYPVIMDAASTENRIKVAADNPTAAIVGIAAEDASGTTGNKVAVWLAKPEYQFLVTTVASDPVDFTDRGACRALQAHASLAIWVVDTTDAGNDSVVIEDYINPVTMELQSTEGDSEVYAVVHFDPKATIYGAGT
jgi:hypothetical protein